jgi:hypothetical protein
MPIFLVLGSDLDVVLVDWRRGNGVRPRGPLAIDRPLERQRLPWFGARGLSV